MAEIFSIVDPRFVLMVLLGSVAGLFVGAIPGLSVSMATAKTTRKYAKESSTCVSNWHNC